MGTICSEKGMSEAHNVPPQHFITPLHSDNVPLS